MVGKEFPAIPSHLKKRRSPQERREELRVVPPFPEPLDVSVDSRETCFPPNASTFKPRIDSDLGGTWDSPVKSLVGKPRGKAYRESHRSLDPRKGKRDTAAKAREESARARHTRDED